MSKSVRIAVYDKAREYIWHPLCTARDEIPDSFVADLNNKTWVPILKYTAFRRGVRDITKKEVRCG